MIGKALSQGHGRKSLSFPASGMMQSKTSELLSPEFPEIEFGENAKIAGRAELGKTGKSAVR